MANPNGNPQNLSHTGRPKGAASKWSADKLYKAIEKSARKDNQDFWDYLIKTAKEQAEDGNTALLCKIMDKVVINPPQTIQHTGDINFINQIPRPENDRNDNPENL